MLTYGATFLFPTGLECQNDFVRILSTPIRNLLRQIAITEMTHAESIAQRLDYLGGIPTTQPTPIAIGESLEEMLRLDIEAEQEAIKLYKQIISSALNEGDYVTAQLFQSILTDEETHHGEFKTLLGE